MRRSARSEAALLLGARNMLLAAAREGRTVTYGRLMRRFRLSRGRRLSQMIGLLDEGEHRRGAPGFAAIVVRKDTGLPGGGYFCDEGLPGTLRRPPRRCTDPRLSGAERRHVKKQQGAVWAYYSRRLSQD